MDSAPHVESSETRVNVTPLAGVREEKKEKNISSLHNNLQGAIRPFHHWKWHSVTYFKDSSFDNTRETCGARSAPTALHVRSSQQSPALHHETSTQTDAFSSSNYTHCKPCIDAVHMSQAVLESYVTPVTHQGPDHMKCSVGEDIKSLCVIMVGLPARGKRFLAKKICRLFAWHGFRAKVLDVQIAWRRLLLQHKAREEKENSSNIPNQNHHDSKECCSLPLHTTIPNTTSTMKAPEGETLGGVISDVYKRSDQSFSLSGDDEYLKLKNEKYKDPQSICIGVEHFRALVSDPDSVERSLYRCILKQYALDAKYFFVDGGNVFIINDDFPTEEMRDEVRAFFTPLVSQTLFMEVVRSGDLNKEFEELKVKDTSEYPSSVDASKAKEDFTRRVEYLKSVYTTPSCDAVFNTANGESAATEHKNCGYVRLIDSEFNEVQNAAGFLASHVVSFVMNLNQSTVHRPIYFVRPGESVYETENRIGGDTALSSKGEEEAKEFLNFLASLKEHHVSAASESVCNEEVGSDKRGNFRLGLSGAQDVVIWTSQLRRSIQMVEHCESLLNIKRLQFRSLNAIHAGIFENLVVSEVQTKHPQIFEFLEAGKYSFRYPKGEGYQDLVLRLQPVIMNLENSENVVVVVGHQCVLRMLLAYFGSTSAESCTRLEIPHRTVWRCRFDSNGVASLDKLDFTHQ